MDATDQAALVAKGEVTPSELLEAAIERIEQSNPSLNAVVIEWFDHARSVAADPDLPDGPFRGVPFLLKDLYASFAGQTLSNGNVALKEAGKIDAADTTLVARFKAAGLVIAGRTNSPEMGSLPTTQPLAWGATRNPWALERTPGGSSGGAAAAVAVGMVPFANASDGGGSIRIPASCCGLVGLKPSQGRITLGPARAEAGLGVEFCVSRTVRDTAGLLDAVRGPGIGDTVIAPAPQRPVHRGGRRRPGSIAHRAARRPPARRLRARGLRNGGARRGVDAGGSRAHGRAGVAGVPRRHHVARDVHGAVGDADGDGGARVQRDARARGDRGRHRAGELGAHRAGAAADRRRLRRGAGSGVGLPAGAAAVVGRRLGPATHADAGRAAAATDGVRRPTPNTRRHRCAGPGGSPRSRRRST